MNTVHLQVRMHKSKYPFYGVHGGTSPGVYQSWDETFLHCCKISGAIAKGFPNRADAERWVQYGPIDSDLWYAVPGEGIYTSWAQAKPKSEKRRNKAFPTKKFKTDSEAREYLVALTASMSAVSL